MSPALLNPVPLRAIYFDGDRYPAERGRSWNVDRYGSVFGAGERVQFACQSTRYDMWFSTSFELRL